MPNKYLSELSPHFTVLKKLGSGGMCKVYLARDEATDGRLVAIKEVIDAASKTQEASERLRTESDFLRKISHPSIVSGRPIEAGNKIFLIMEFAEEGTLRDKLESGIIDHKIVEKAVRSILEALVLIHDQGFVHRDIKPENILCFSDGSFKLSDFGLVREIGSSSMTQDNFVMGTVAYIPPEYVETGESDYRGDLYALGITLHELLTGTTPFSGLSTAEVLKKKFLPNQSQKLIAHGAPQHLIKLFEKLSQPKLRERCQSAMEGLKLLDQN